MKLYRVDEGVVVEDGSGAYLIEDDWDELLNRGNLFKYLKSLLGRRLGRAVMRNLHVEINGCPSGRWIWRPTPQSI